MARYETVGQAINDALVEVGLNTTVDAFSSADPAVSQMATLASTCGRHLIKLFGWEYFQKEVVITTQEDDTGKYPLPDDFDHMIDQTSWSRTQRVVLPGSVGADIWQYLRGRNLVSSTIYMVFRQVQGEFQVYPQPPDAPVPAGITFAFEYASRGWVYDSGQQEYKDRAESMGDLVQFDPLLFSRFLKYRFKEARGMDVQSAQQEFWQVFSSVSGQDTADYALNVANMSQPYPYLDMHRNTPDSGYGM